MSIGRSIIVDGRARTIVGVMPAEFVPPYFSKAKRGSPIDMTTLLADIRTRRTLTVLARRAPTRPSGCRRVSGAVLEAAAGTLSGDARGQTWVAIPLRDELVGSARPALVATAAAAVLLLLIVATNIAGLSTAHAVAMRHQLAVRAALGATRARLFVEQLVDSSCSALVGSIAGIWIAYGLVRVVARYQQFFLGRLAPMSLDVATIVAASAPDF